jgi:hypothetical protein
MTGCPWSHGLRPIKLSVSMAVPPAPVRVPNQRPLAPSVASVTSDANDKGDDEMILGAVHRSPGRGKPQKTSARRPIITWISCSKSTFYLQVNSLLTELLKYQKIIFSLKINLMTRKYIEVEKLCLIYWILKESLAAYDKSDVPLATISLREHLFASVR